MWHDVLLLTSLRCSDRLSIQTTFKASYTFIALGTDEWFANILHSEKAEQGYVITDKI